jgi:flavin-dependent dehydrogenase
MVQKDHGEQNADVVVLGGGLAGLTLALQCHQQSPQARILVLEKNSHPVPEAAFKVGESTVEVGAHYFAKVLGFESHIISEQLPKLGLRFFFRAGNNSAIDRRLEIGSSQYAPTPSYQLDRGRFENFLGQQCLVAGIEFVDQARVKEVCFGRGRSDHQVCYARDGQSHVVKTRWVADASGRACLLKRKLGLQKSSPHKANATWFRVGARIKVDDWSDGAEWCSEYKASGQRWYSTNHLMGEGYWVWLIPLASGATSVGIVADERSHPLSSYNSLEKSLRWLEQHEPQCGEQIRLHENQIQDFRAIKQYAVECTQVFSHRRWGITGEAGFFVDPFYSPGSDFIAFGNTLLADLIRRDLSRKGIRFQSKVYEFIFKAFYHGTAEVYQDQYQLFGNHQVMPVKIFWDWMIYWTLTAPVFIQGRMCDVNMYPRLASKLKKLRRLNQLMQEFFRTWHQRCGSREIDASIDVFDIEAIPELNSRLVENLTSREFRRRFGQNVAQLETVFWEIVDHANLDVSVPLRRTCHRHTRKHSLQHIFDATTKAAASVNNGDLACTQSSVVTKP